MNNNELYIKPLVEQLTLRSREWGFTSFEKLFHGGGRDVLLRWLRWNTWKSEVIQLVHFKDNPRACRIDFQLYLILEDKEYIFTAISVSDYKRHKFEFIFPTLFGKLRAGSVIDSIVEDVRGTLDWFNKYDKKTCLKLINKNIPSENIMISKTGRIYSAVERLLLSE